MSGSKPALATTIESLVTNDNFSADCWAMVYDSYIPRFYGQLLSETGKLELGIKRDENQCKIEGKQLGLDLPMIQELFISTEYLNEYQ